MPHYVYIIIVGIYSAVYKCNWKLCFLYGFCIIPFLFSVSILQFMAALLSTSPLQLTLIRTCIWFGNLTTVIALLAWPKTCVPWWSLTHNNLSLCAVSVSGSLITSATVGRCLRLCLSCSIPFSDSISFCSVSVSFHSLLSCCLSSPLQAGKTGLLKKETRSWHSLNKEREGESCKEQEDREAFIVTGPRPQVCLTRSAAVATGTLKCLFSY